MSSGAKVFVIVVLSNVSEHEINKKEKKNQNKTIRSIDRVFARTRHLFTEMMANRIRKIIAGDP